MLINQITQKYSLMATVELNDHLFSGVIGGQSGAIIDKLHPYLQFLEIRFFIRLLLKEITEYDFICQM